MLYNNYHNRNIGRIGENIACKYIESIGYKVIDRNYRTRYGEIDIIAIISGDTSKIKNEEVVFIEVKTRLSGNKGRGAEKVDLKKISKMVMVAKKYAYENRLLNTRLRFDVIEINLYTGGQLLDGGAKEKVRINHLKNILL